MTVQNSVNPQTVNTAQQQLEALENQLEAHTLEQQQLADRKLLLSQAEAEATAQESQLKAAIAAKVSELEQARSALSIQQQQDFKTMEKRFAALKTQAGKVNVAYQQYQSLLAELVQAGGDQSLTTLSASLSRPRPLQLDGRVPELRNLKQDGFVVIDHGENLAIVTQEIAQKRNWQLV